MTQRLVLILGGTRSGKSRYAQARAIELSGPGRVTYVATAFRGDPELEARIHAHRAARPRHWQTIEAGSDLAASLAAIEPIETVLIDGLTLWLSGAFDPERTTVEAFLGGPLDAVMEVIARRTGAVIIVSDEVNMGLVPMDPAARTFRDLIGLAHQRIASVADEAYLMVAGLALPLKAG